MLRGGEGKQATASLKILSPLGAGGFGAVYEALDTRTGQLVAVKQLDDTSADSIARFKHEFRALSDCHHENLVGLRELIEQDGRWLIVMELVPGTDFLRYVRLAENDNAEPAQPLYDDQRLRTALIGMVHGLRALHGFGVVHRDLKPSNVRVRPDGRAVLLDFGLATSVDPKQQSTHAMGVGTVVYMAPEQAGNVSVGPAADMYALGVCLFEALTGQAPFEGNHAIKILLDKQRMPAPRARSLVGSVPLELDELCARLLAIDPSVRPSAEEVLSVLTRTPLVRASLPLPATSLEPNFAGRDGELAHLERALALTHEGEQRLVLVEGESGVGKSELVSEFLRRASADQPRLLTLRGRCYENEQVSYKAFDGCIDELSKYLRRLPPQECAALIPERGGLLGQLFPVLRNVPAIAKASREGSSADPTARRLEAFGALSRLLGKLAEDRPVALVLDDLQWADAESFRLMLALREQTPRAPLLLLATLRPRDELEPEVHAQIDALRKWTETDVISLFGLPRAQAKTLARKLLGDGAPEALLDLIASESQGHPLFMSELVQYTQSHDFATRSSLTIDAALRARIDGLERGAGELLELVALAARPYPSTVFASALSKNVEETVRALLARKLLRQRKGHEVGCFHDRIRHAAVGLIARARLPVLHHQLASALEEFPGADASEHARHWDLAGKPERASGAYERAATKAFSALAFTRAAELFARAIELLQDRADPRFLTLTTQRAEALVSAGRSGEAATLFEQAAQVAGGEQRILLRSSAAMHMILGAKIAPGVAAGSQLLRELGFKIPVNSLAWLARFSWDALRLRFSRIDGAPRTQHVPESERIAISAARPLLRALAIVDARLYFGLLMQFARRSANLGIRSNSAYALTMRGWLRALRGSLDSALPLVERARQLMEGENDPYDVALQAFMAGSVHQAALDWCGSLDHLTRAERIAQEHCPQPWLLTMIRYHLGAAWFFSGQHAELSRELERWLVEARERNDVFGAGLLAGMGYGFARHLMRDQPQAALDELRHGVALLPREPYSFVHVGELIGSTLSLLYMGGPAALRFIDAYAAEHQGSFLMRGGNARQGILLMRVPALLSAYVAASVKERPVLLAAAKRATKKLMLDRSPTLVANATLAQAQIDALEGQLTSALGHARDAVSCFRALKHDYARYAEYVEGLLEGGIAGSKKCAAVVAEIRAQGWQNPLRAIAQRAPAYELISQARGSASESRAALLHDRYEVTGQLGSGGFGVVVAARDVHSGRTVALKELVRTGGMSLDRFKQEFRTLADLHHEHIVQLEGMFEHDGAWYIVMERVSGADLTSYVRASGACDPERLKRAALGVVRALSALHHKGFVHRDVKPANVIVSDEGRAVLIDFGLVARIGDEREANVVGSSEYGAPEQLRGALPDPAADVYDLGASLYQAISGANPPGETVPAQRRARDQSARLNLKAPEGLEELWALIQRTLAPDATARPTLQDMARALGESWAGEEGRGSMARAGLEESAQESLFAGRKKEHAWLHAILERARESGMRIALIEGESGLGKSALVSDFARHTPRKRAPIEVLKSRCYEHEQIAFKAFDGVVDQLAQLLRGLLRTTCEALLPKRAVLLAQLFPVLGSVAAIAGAPKKGLPADPLARKQAGFECFVQLLENVSTERELLLVIDDLQWADSESFDMLQALAKHAERIPLMVLCTVRPRAELEPLLQSQLANLRALPNCDCLALEPLDPSALSSLARQLLDELPPERLVELVRESGGHPLFLRELVEHEKRGTRDKSQALTLDVALATRIESLQAEARDVLGLVALADKPHPLHVYARAAQRRELPRDALIALLGQGLLQRRGDRLACYHDRIRRAVIGRLSREQRADAAKRLAEALSHAECQGEKTARDAAELARLWDEAGERAKAIAAYEEAGDQALETLAFVRAEEHYARALELFPDGSCDAAWQRLQVSRGHALVRAGRSAEAARCFQRAAQHAQGEHKVRLRIWVAQHLIQSAQVSEGMRAASELLAELGIALPESEGAAKGRILLERARVKMRGIQLKRRRGSLSDGLALDALHGLSAPVRAVSFLPGSALVTQYLRRALDAGDSRHAARALAYEALWRSLKAPERSQEALFDHSSALAAATGEPALIAELELTRGVAATAQAQQEAAIIHLVRAHDILTAQCPGQPWLLTAVRSQLGSAWFYRCQFRELRQHAEVWVKEARARDDCYAIASLSGYGCASFRHALDDDVEAGLAELDDAMRPWPVEPFSTVQLGAFLTTNFLMECTDDGPRRLHYLEAQHARFSRAYLMRAANLRFLWPAFRIHALLKCITTVASADTATLIARARAERRPIAKIATPVLLSIAHYFEAWLHLLEGNQAAALKELTILRGGFRNPYYTPAIDYLQGKLEGGDAGRLLCEQALADLRDEGWRNVQRGLALRLPVTLAVCDKLIGLP